MNEIPIFFAVDDNYAPFLAATLRSLLDNGSKDYTYAVHILIDELSEKNRKRLLSLKTENSRIGFFSVKKRLSQPGTTFQLRDYYTSATYYRFFIPALFPEYDRCIYLDSDLIITGDVSVIYRALAPGRLVAAVNDDVITGSEIFSRYTRAVLNIAPGSYFNAGVLVMDLKRMREISLEQRFRELIAVRRFPVAQDQDYLNVLCRGNVTWLDHTWNFTAFPNVRKLFVPRIIHFKMSYRPWKYRGIPFEEEFWKYAAKTPYASELEKMPEEYTDAEKALDEKRALSLLELAVRETEKARSRAASAVFTPAASVSEA